LLYKKVFLFQALNKSKDQFWSCQFEKKTTLKPIVKHQYYEEKK